MACSMLQKPTLNKSCKRDILQRLLNIAKARINVAKILPSTTTLTFATHAKTLQKIFYNVFWSLQKPFFSVVCAQSKNLLDCTYSLKFDN